MLFRSPGGLLERVNDVRRRLAQDLGVVLPSVRIRDDASLPPQGYCVRLRDAVAGAGTIRPAGVLVMDPSGAAPQVDGETVSEPSFGLPAVWTDPASASELQSRGLAVLDPASALGAHLLEVLRRRAWELLTVEETGRLLDRLRRSAQIGRAHV